MASLLSSLQEEGHRQPRAAYKTLGGVLGRVLVPQIQEQIVEMVAVQCIETPAVDVPCDHAAQVPAVPCRSIPVASQRMVLTVATCAEKSAITRCSFWKRFLACPLLCNDWHAGPDSAENRLEVAWSTFLRSSSDVDSWWFLSTVP